MRPSLDTARTLGDAFTLAAELHGDRDVLICGDQRWGYREFGTLTASVAAGLTALVEPGTEGPGGRSIGHRIRRGADRLRRPSRRAPKSRPT
ncbi:hypothetical protein ACFWUP_15205 [Nocardia sp. NPDC058658]|uniref:hypothetical protein n=1 Tax=Nocardia sp. NPDC058658 TaxID=3346580 RepID=UPI00365E0D97